MANVVKLLIEPGANPTVPRGDGKTALELALKHRHPITAGILQRHEAR
jgi:ankyrin repeat protein